jgi:TctA family transporter
MARRGRAGAALAVAALASFFAGTVATLIVAVASPAMVKFAMLFGAAEYFSLMAFGLVAAIVLAHGSVAKAIAMTVLGLLLGLCGTDVNSGTQRFTFGIPELSDGIGFVPLAMGLFAIAEIAVQLAGGKKLAEIPGSMVWNQGPNKANMHAIFLRPVPVTRDNLAVVIDAGWSTKAAVCQGVPAGRVAACN